MATPTTSGRNPFRSPAATPNTTGAPSSASSSSATHPARPNDSAVANLAHSDEPTGLDEDLPPAYTPSPDVHHGESTVEQGPRRPFQPAPPPPPAQPQPIPWQPPPQVPAIHVEPPLPFHTQGPPSLLRQLVDTITTQLTGPGPTYGRPGVSPQQTGSSSWSGFPGQQQQQHLQPNYASYGAGPSTPDSHSPGPPPLPPRRASNPASPASPTSPASDFARDFYAAGTGDSNSQPNAGSSGYTPPPGPPPTTPPNSGHAPSSARPPPAPTPPSDDGRPTKSPTPGRPLLKDGKLLVYPKGFTCPKCHNIGFKHADPSHPCRKCWSKYSKPFSGPLAYSFSSPASPSSTTTTTFQRPLPAFRSPRQAAPPPPPSPPRHPQQHPPHQPAYHIPSPPNPIPHQPYAAPPHQQIRTLSPYAAPPPDAIVYPAGDPRLGGRMCWNCGGRGSVSLFMFDSMRCEGCAGLGRVFS
ncbi:hypothetical protein FPV67DRAFT_629889 [Lyophyllum atratum]|nr:hypothetical protein FPV67DRAFT_629889 [Lyophyllum atratum]